MSSAFETPYAPSGQQVEIRHTAPDGEHVATVVEVGGGLRSYTVDGQDVIDGYGVEQMSNGGRGAHLFPWPNRIRNGRYTWDGHDIQAPLNDFPYGHAIHGVTRWANWTISERSTSAVTMSLTLHPVQGYPFALALWARHELTDNGLVVTVGARNIGTVAAPFAYAPHPYFSLGTGETVDTDLLQVPADTCALLDDVGIPVGRTPVEGTPYDFRSPAPIGDLKLDTTFTDLTADADGMCSVTLASSDGARSAWLWFDVATFPWVQVFSGDTVPEVERRRYSIAVEPMTAPADAFATGEDVVRLEPGDEWTGTWGISRS